LSQQIGGNPLRGVERIYTMYVVAAMFYGGSATRRLQMCRVPAAVCRAWSRATSSLRTVKG
jgi:uncharacterized Fe-S cluster-containing radical SAM superfamily protein